MKDNKLKSLLCTVASDSHMWNLMFIQLFLQEHGFDVSNLGVCTPMDWVTQKIVEEQPDLLVVSTINGHGYVEGRRLITHLNTRFGDSCPKVVIGGKLSIDPSQDQEIAQHLTLLGYEQVFMGDSLDPFSAYLTELKANKLICDKRLDQLLEREYSDSMIA